MVDTRRHLPATEALNRVERQEKPRPHRRRRVATPPTRKNATKRKSSFDMTDLMGATRPLEEVIAFPKIEWAQDEDESDHHEFLPLHNDSDHFLSSDHSHSSPILGKRIRREHHGLVRSKSLKSSLCYLAEQSTSRRRSITKANDGSWGQFVSNSDEEQEMIYKGIKHHRSNGDKLDLLLAPLMVFCPSEQNDLE